MTAPHLEALRDVLLKHALEHVPFDGWSRETLRLAAADAGLDPLTLDTAFPGGVRDAVAHMADWADRGMVAALADTPLSQMRHRDRVTAAIQTRCALLAPHQEAVRRAAAVLARPDNSLLALRLTARTVDAIWWAIGDTSTDFNWYTKRASLGAVYSATMLVWMDDRSPDFADTWAFLDRRIGDIMVIPRLKGRVRQGLSRLPDPRRLVPPRRIG